VLDGLYYFLATHLGTQLHAASLEFSQQQKVDRGFFIKQTRAEFLETRMDVLREILKKYFPEPVGRPTVL
jgi:hypothetical protein